MIIEILFLFFLITRMFVKIFIPFSRIAWKINNHLHKFTNKYILNLSNELIGDKNVFNKNGVIFISNHYNLTDVFILYEIFKEDTYAVAKSDLLSHIGIKSKFINNLFFRGTNGISYIRNNLNSGDLVKKIC